MIINKNHKVATNVKQIRLHCKVRDGFTATIVDVDGKEIKDYEGYVPDFMPGPHYGDYLKLNIDLDTGMITNWPKISVEQMEEFINEEGE